MLNSVMVCYIACYTGWIFCSSAGAAGGGSAGKSSCGMGYHSDPFCGVEKLSLTARLISSLAAYLKCRGSVHFSVLGQYRLHRCIWADECLSYICDNDDFEETLDDRESKLAHKSTRAEREKRIPRIEVYVRVCTVPIFQTYGKYNKKTTTITP
jgi:hypothetical protein